MGVDKPSDKGVKGGHRLSRRFWAHLPHRRRSDNVTEDQGHGARRQALSRLRLQSPTRLIHRDSIAAAGTQTIIPSDDLAPQAPMEWKAPEPLESAERLAWTLGSGFGCNPFNVATAIARAAESITPGEQEVLDKLNEMFGVSTPSGERRAANPGAAVLKVESASRSTKPRIAGRRGRESTAAGDW